MCAGVLDSHTVYHKSKSRVRLQSILSMKYVLELSLILAKYLVSLSKFL